jgi:hypothetical protein
MGNIRSLLKTSYGKGVVMSKQIATLNNTGSRGVDLDVTRYSGGPAGTCYQLTGEEEEGSIGYVQLTQEDIIKLCAIIINEQKEKKAYLNWIVKDIEYVLSEVQHDYEIYDEWCVLRELILKLLGETSNKLG